MFQLSRFMRLDVRYVGLTATVRGEIFNVGVVKM